MNSGRANATPDASSNEAIAPARCAAAIATIQQLAGNLRTIRRGDFPPEAKRRISEILRLSEETVRILDRRRSELEHGSDAAE